MENEEQKNQIQEQEATTLTEDPTEVNTLTEERTEVNIETEAPERVELAFVAEYDDILSGLNSTDKQDGTERKNKTRFFMLCTLAALELISFSQSRNGFALCLALLFGGLGIFLKKKGLGVNNGIAKAFADEGAQSLVLADEAMWVTGKKIGYNEDVKAYDTDDCFSLIYHKNHVFIIAKKLLKETEIEATTQKLKEVLGDSYKDCTTEKPEDEE